MSRPDGDLRVNQVEPGTESPIVNPLHWRRVDILFHDALERPPGQRERWLAQNCAGDAALRSELDSLLAAHEHSSSFLETPPFDTPPPAPSSSESGTQLPSDTRFGRYVIRRILGRGGMGVVYEAEQDYPRRTVALKLLRSDVATAEVRRRFADEAQILARLDHPGIARIFDAGAIDHDGETQPYLAMEIVSGEPLIAFAFQRKITLAGRLALFAEVCDAVQHAHEKGVLHRDLKPANILVSTDARPRILDFGIARLADADRHATGSTEIGRLLGTLAYMSPEQVRGEIDSIDTRSDIYSLGVILYELVTDRLPYDLSDRNIVAAARIISEDAPHSPRAIRRTIPADLDTILLKSLEKEPSRRYASAAALADDIRRCIAHRPILARPPSTAYLVRKLIARHRIASTVVVLLLIGLVALTITSAWFARRYADQRDAAQLAATQERDARKTTDEVTAFIQSAIAGADPFSAKDKEPSLRDIVASADSRLAELNDQPLVQARVKAFLAQVHESLANHDVAARYYEDSIAAVRSILGPDHPDLAALLSDQSGLFSAMGDHAAAVRAARDALRILEHARGPGHRDTAVALGTLGSAQYHARAMDDALESFQRALDIHRAADPVGDLHTATALTNLGHACSEKGLPARAADYLREALAIRERIEGDSHDVCHALQGLARAVHQSDPQEAIRLLTRRLDVARRVFHDQHPNIAMALNDLAFLLSGRDAPAAQKLYEEALAIRRATLGPDHPEVANSLHDLGALRKNRGDVQGALDAHEEALRIRRLHFGERDLRVSYSLNSLAIACQALDRIHEAVRYSELVLEIWRAHYGESHVMTAVALQNHSVNLARIHEFDAAEEHLQAASDIYTALKHPNLSGLLMLRGSTMQLAGRFEDAESMYLEALAICRASATTTPAHLAQLLFSLAAVADLLGRVEDARGLHLDSLASYREVLAPGDPALIGPLTALAEISLRQTGGVPQEMLDEITAIEPRLLRNDPQRGTVLALLAGEALARDCPREALDHSTEALRIHEKRFGPDHWRTAITRALLGHSLLHLATNDIPDHATLATEIGDDSNARAAARKALDSALPILLSVLGPDHPSTTDALAAKRGLDNRLN